MRIFFPANNHLPFVGIVLPGPLVPGRAAGFLEGGHFTGLAFVLLAIVPPAGRIMTNFAFTYNSPQALMKPGPRLATEKREFPARPPRSYHIGPSIGALLYE